MLQRHLRRHETRRLKLLNRSSSSSTTRLRKKQRKISDDSNTHMNTDTNTNDYIKQESEVPTSLPDNQLQMDLDMDLNLDLSILNSLNGNVNPGSCSFSDLNSFPISDPNPISNEIITPLPNRISPSHSGINLNEIDLLSWLFTTPTPGSDTLSTNGSITNFNLTPPNNPVTSTPTTFIQPSIPELELDIPVTIPPIPPSIPSISNNNENFNVKVNNFQPHQNQHQHQHHHHHHHHHYNNQTSDYFNHQYPYSIFSNTTQSIEIPHVISPPSPPTENDIQISESKVNEMISLIPLLSLMNNNNDTKDLLSVLSFQKYIKNYWNFFHPRFPILHYPTFKINEINSSFLLSIVLIGIAYEQFLNPQFFIKKKNIHKHDSNEKETQLDYDNENGNDEKIDLANYLATDLRWILFSLDEFNPPAKLWVIQSLLLLEFYEKNMSNRKLHERSHLHHGTTIQLLRRSSALLENDNNNNSDNENGENGSGSVEENFVDKSSWHKWIKIEETKRVALFCFYIDVMDAIFFTHSIILNINEIRLNLPCSDELWEEYIYCNSTDYDLNRRFPTSIGNYNIQQINNDSPNSIDSSLGSISTITESTIVTGISFLTALKDILHGKSVKTSSFGYTVLFSGMIAVSYQLQQQELQFNSLGLSSSNLSSQNINNLNNNNSNGNGNLSMNYQSKFSNDNILKKSSYDYRWREILAPAISFWYYNDKSNLIKGINCNRNLYISNSLLFHTSIIGLKVKLDDLQIYAGAPKMLNHSINLSKEWQNSKLKINNWSIGLNGKICYLHGIICLSKIFLSKNEQNWYDDLIRMFTDDIKININDFNKLRDNLNKDENIDMDENGYGDVNGNETPFNLPDGKNLYMIAICTLVCWAYGYCLEGPEDFELETKATSSSSSSSSSSLSSESSNSSNFNSKINGIDYLKRIQIDLTNYALQIYNQIQLNNQNFPHKKKKLNYYEAFLILSNGLSIIKNKNYSVGLLRLVINFLIKTTTNYKNYNIETISWDNKLDIQQQENINENIEDGLHWDILNEEIRLLNNCVLRSLGRCKIQCDAMFI